MGKTLVAFALALAAGVASVGEATVTLSLTNAPLSEAAAAIAKQGKIAVVVRGRPEGTSAKLFRREIDKGGRTYSMAMRNTDQRISEDKPVTPGFLIAVVLWQDYLARIAELEADLKPAEARAHAAVDCLTEQHQVITIPRRFSQFARDVWGLQNRLEARSPRTINRLLAHPKFRAGYDFLVLRAEAGEAPTEVAEWWTSYQDVTESEQKSMVDALRGNQPPASRKKKRRRSRRSGSRGAAGSSDGQSSPDGAVD